MYKLLILSLLLIPEAFAWPETLKCEFSYGVIFDKNDKGYQSSSMQDKFELLFDNINLKNNEARLIGNVGAVNVSIINRKNHLHFLEVTPMGILNTTTIYKNDEDNRTLQAVTSRHVITTLPGLNKELFMPSQQVGTCKPLLN